MSSLMKNKGVEIVEGAVCADHVHLCQHTADDEPVKVYGGLEGEKCPNDF